MIYLNLNFNFNLVLYFLFLFMKEARRQGDESLLSITNEWLKARVFAKVPAERSEDEN